jgi:hypothetical protein
VYASAANGGTSFANEYAKKHMVKIVVNVLFALTADDIKKIIEENNLK